MERNRSTANAPFTPRTRASRGAKGIVENVDLDSALHDAYLTCVELITERGTSTSTAVLRFYIPHYVRFYGWEEEDRLVILCMNWTEVEFDSESKPIPLRELAVLLDQGKFDVYTAEIDNSVLMLSGALLPEDADDVFIEARVRADRFDVTWPGCQDRSGEPEFRRAEDLAAIGDIYWEGFKRKLRTVDEWRQSKDVP